MYNHNMLATTSSRYASRAVMIEFSLPQLDPSVTEYTNLPALMENSVKSIGFLISLGKRFVTSGITEIDEVLTPRLKMMLPKGIWPRIVPGYALLLWFAYQVMNDCINIHVYIYIHTYIHTCTYICTYIIMYIHKACIACTLTQHCKQNCTRPFE